MRVTVFAYSDVLVVTLDDGRLIGAYVTYDTPTTPTVMSSDKLDKKKVYQIMIIIDYYTARELGYELGNFKGFYITTSSE